MNYSTRIIWHFDIILFRKIEHFASVYFANLHLATFLNSKWFDSVFRNFFAYGNCYISQISRFGKFLKKDKKFAKSKNLRNKIICEIEKICQIGLTRHFAIIHMAITLFSKNEHLASEYFVTTLLMSTITDCCLITLSSSNLDCGGSQTWTSVWTCVSRNWEKQLWNWHLKTAPFTNDSLF